jgi:molybdopterin molybdotransferase
MDFLRVDSVETVQSKIFSCVKDWMPRIENIPLSEACGRILAADVLSPLDIPAFRRSTVDGYAVLSKDTAAAGESIPVFLTVKAFVEMGQPASLAIKNGECAGVPTGGMLPDGADAVVMVEYSEDFGPDGIAVYDSVAYGENVVEIGEDKNKGELLLGRRRRLLPQDIGALAAAGIISVPVYALTRLTIFSTGDELVHPEAEPKLGQIRDINTYALTALAVKHGFLVVQSAVLPDSEAVLEESLRGAMENSDIIIVSGGSSQGEKDMTAAIIDKVSKPGVLTHGLALKPGKPTILGYDEYSRTLLAGLPGHPVSAMMVFELLFGSLQRELTGLVPPFSIPAKLLLNVASSPGKTTCYPVKIHRDGGEYAVEPIFGKSGLITTLTEADGYFVIERDKEGLQAGATVFVNLF